MEITLTFDGLNYSVAVGEDGWIYVTGADKFRFIRDEKFYWHFSKPIDNDLKVLLKLQAVVNGISRHALQ